MAAGSKGENAGDEEAKKEADKELQDKLKEPNAVPKKIDPPVPGRQKLDCKALIDPTQFTQLLGETEPVSVVDSKTEADAAAACSIIRGGKRLTEAQQKALLQSKGRPGAVTGDELGNVAPVRWTHEHATLLL